MKANMNKDEPDTVDECRTWLDGLSDEDLMFVKRFVLASGSLKGLAAAYGVSYPTVRLRVDRLIAKVKILDDRDVDSGFERTLRLLYAEGSMDLVALKRLRAAHANDMERDDE